MLIFRITIEGPGNPSLQFSTRCVHNLAIDGLDENYIASCYPNNDASICIWDKRSGSRYTSPAINSATAVDSGQLPVALELKNVVDPKSTIQSLRFSKTKRGCLGMLSSNGRLKAYEIAKEYVSEPHRISLENTIGLDSSRNYPEQVYTKSVRSFQTGLSEKGSVDNLQSGVSSFDFLNTNLSNEPAAIILRTDKTAAISKLRSPPPPIDLSSNGMLVRGGYVQSDSEFGSIAASPGKKSAETVRGIRDRSQSSKSPKTDSPSDVAISSRENREQLLSIGPVSETRDVLAWLTVQRIRCLEGYLFDCQKNKSIVSDDPGLEGLWDWIQRIIFNLLNLFYMY